MHDTRSRGATVDEAATACLEADMVAEPLAVLATVEPHDVPLDAMP